MRIRTPKKNKSDILKTYLQSQTDLTPKINEAIFDRFYDILEKNISDHISIELRNFGAFKIKFMKPRFGSDPRNKNKIYIPSKWKVTFKASENVNKKLNEKI
jgi:integration host factor subunit beta